jgi:hypothetical protein
VHFSYFDIIRNALKGIIHVYQGWRTRGIETSVGSCKLEDKVFILVINTT